MLQVGTGSILGKNKIMEHAKPNHPERILSAGLSSGWDAVGRWQISNIEGILSYEQYLIIFYTNALICKCMYDAHVIVTVLPNDVNNIMCLRPHNESFGDGCIMTS